MKFAQRVSVAWKILSGGGPARPTQTRIYHAAKVSRLTDGWSTAQSSADAELYTSLRNMRGRSRALIRDSSYAKRAKVIVVNNVIGAGMGLQGNVLSADGKRFKAVNDGIEEAWNIWSRPDSCHTGGSLHFADLERALMGQVFDAGEVFVRVHRGRFGGSTVPLALELIEAERLADDYGQPVGANGENEIRMGVEVNDFGRPVAYWFRQRHPGELRYGVGQTDKLVRVPADQVFHLRVIDRWPQTRGEPWLHTAMRRLNDMDGYAEAEIIAARASASYMGFVESEGEPRPLADQNSDPAVPPTTTLEAGSIEYLGPGQKFTGYAPTRPNTAIDPFLSYMLREVAAGVGCSFESLSRNYSQSNYSSSRLALLDDRDLWRTLQLWWVRNFREPLHRIWLETAVLAGAVQGLTTASYIARPEHYSRVLFKPRGWSWIDPTKEVEAYIAARKAGFISTADIIAQTANGRDIEDVWNEIKAENEMQADMGLEFDNEPKAAEPQQPSAPKNTPAPTESDGGNEGEEPDDAGTRVLTLLQVTG